MVNGLLKAAEVADIFASAADKEADKRKRNGNLRGAATAQEQANTVRAMAKTFRTMALVHGESPEVIGTRDDTTVPATVPIRITR